MRGVMRVMVVAALVTGLPLGLGDRAEAVRVPETLADRRPVQAGPVEPGFPVQHLGVVWETGTGEHDEHHGTASHGEVRFRHDGRWGPWLALIEDGADAPGQWASGLVGGGGADAYQVRGVPDHARDARAVALNTTDGPAVTVGSRPASSADAVAGCVSRSEWGADESLRFDGDVEIWPPEHFPVQVLTVHHTATSNDDPDPAATMRAIYEYHAVDRGWGDIGYQYLIDEQGHVYEGRWSGQASVPCSEGGDGRDFAHDSTLDGADMVTGAHVGGYNSGNMGVALLGEFTDHRRFGAEPTAAAVDSLESVLAELAGRHGLDPHATVTYENPHPSSDATRVVDMISGHQDWVATECPGERLYDDLPEIRDAVAALLGGDTGGTDGDTGTGGAGTSVHVADLDGSNANDGGTWTASVVIEVVDDTGASVGGATVTGTWADGATGTATCATDASGRCSVSAGGIPKRTGSVSFTVDGVAAELSYDSSANTDPDGDSDGTRIVVAKP